MRHLGLLLLLWAVPSSIPARETTPSMLVGQVKPQENADPKEFSTDTIPQLVLGDTAVVIPKLDFTSVPLVDALTALVRSYRLSVAIDSSVTGNVTLQLHNTRLIDALRFILREHQLSFRQVGDIVTIYRPMLPPPALPPVNITISEGLVSLDVTNVSLERFVRTFAEVTGVNAMIQAGTTGRITGKLTNLDPERALSVLLATNGLTVAEADGIFYISSGTAQAGLMLPVRSSSVICDSGLVTVHATGVLLSEVVSALANQCQLALLQLIPLEGTVTASFEALPMEDALVTLLWNTAYTYRQSSGVWLVGSRDSEDLFDTRMVKLDHLIAVTIEPLIPASLTKNVAVKVIKEHNGLLLTGPRTSIAKVEAFIDEVDVPAAQVLFEVLVVDYTTTERAEFEIRTNNFTVDDNKKTYFPGLDLAAQGNDLNDDLNSLSQHLGISNLGKLPNNFYIRLRWLEQEGKAHIRSHPKIAALNGHPASISIGTTQYYLLESSTIYPSQQTSVSTQTSQRFEKVEADMSLEVIPYVNGSGELIVEVKPEFNTPAQAFDPDIPPTINRRILNSTVRLRDGETIILGGLVQTSRSAQIDKLPILGSIPILGRLFQNRTSADVTSELIIYLTPHVYYGSEGSVDMKKVLKK